MNTERVLVWLRAGAAQWSASAFAILAFGGAGFGLGAFGLGAVLALPVTFLIAWALKDDDSDSRLTAYTVSGGVSLFGVYLVGAGFGLSVGATLPKPLPLTEDFGAPVMVAGLVILLVAGIAHDLVFHPERGLRPSPEEGSA